MSLRVPLRETIRGIPVLGLAACVLTTTPTAAQDGTVPQVIHLDIQGLPIAPITALVKDRGGFLWIGTENGLCRYDGINVDLYRTVPGDSTSIQGNFIEDLVLDGEGRLWVACFGGVSVWDPGQGAWGRKPHFQRKLLFAKNERQSSYEAKELFMDAEGGLWLAAVGNGLAAYDPASDAFHEEKALRAALPPGDRTAFTTGVLRDASGVVWTVDHLSVYRYDPHGGAVKRYAFDRPGFEEWRGALLSHITQDLLDPEVLWLETWGAGLLRFNKRTGIFEQFMLTQGGPVNITNLIWSILPQADGRLLVGINQDLRWFDPRSRSFSETFSTFQWKTGRFEAWAYALLQDEDERTWVGTHQGLFVLPAVSTDLAQWTSRVSHQCVATNHNGYWGARMYTQRVLFKLGPSGEVLDSLPIPNADARRIEPFCILQARDHLVHIGTNDGLITYDPGTRIFRSERLIELPGMNGRSPSIISMAETDDGAVWLAGVGRGLVRYRPNDGPQLLEPTVDAKDSSSLRAMSSFMGMGNGRLAVTLQNKGVGVLDTRTMRLTVLNARDPGGEALATVVSIVPTANGKLYAVTGNDGIVELEYDGRSLRHTGTYTNEQDPTNYFNDAAADTLGNIWIASATGLVRFDLATHAFQHIGPLDGLGMSFLSSILATGDGRMLVWHHRCARFDPRTLARQAPVNGLYIRSMSVNGQLVELATTDHGEAPIELRHDRNSITITYAPIALFHAAELRYEVMLDGHDAHWQDNGYERAVSFIGLPPGQYTFQVRVQGGATASVVTSVPFTIVPAYWQTWWFQAIAILFSGALIFLLARYILSLRYRQRIATLEREREIGAVRTRIARDIHDDLGSGLTRITMLSREMNSAKETPETKDRLAGSIAHASTELIGQLSEIVWTVDPKNDHAESFIAFVRDLLGRQFEELSVALRADLSVEPGMEQRDIPPDTKRNVVMILKETVSNALKHARARTVSVRLHIGASELALHVEDDGSGFNTSVERSHGNGLGNLRKRSEVIGGTLTVESDAAGTRYALRVPLPSPTFMRGQ